MRRLIRVAVHVAAWVPFLVSVRDSWRGSWRVVGDGAVIALGAWATFTRIPLVGQPTEFPGGPHDLGPAEYWLLAVPVHVDPARGVLWGAALLCMAAASVAIEAAWSVAGEAGGVVAGGVVLGIAAWMPGLVFRPYWNPYFGAMFFLAALAAGWAVMSGRRRWWPVLVVAASVAAQAHLMFALGAAAVTAAALIAGLAGRPRAGWRWAAGGLAAGLACWMAPLDQQLTYRAGNMSLLLDAGRTSRHPGLGLTFAMKALTAFTQPPPLWSRLHLGQRQHISRLLETRPPGFAAAVLAITTAALLITAARPGSRKLASLTAITLLAAATAAITISRIPAGHGDPGRLSYLILVLYPAGLLTWLTAAAALTLTARHLITRTRHPATGTGTGPAQPPGTTGHLTRLARTGTRAAAIPVLLLASLPGLIQQSAHPPAGRNATQVSTAAALIKHTLPTPQAITLAITVRKPDRYRILTGLNWALAGAGYSVDFNSTGLTRPIPHITVHIHGSKITINLTKTPATNPTAATQPGQRQPPAPHRGINPDL